MNTIAKIQAGNTWELSAVPYIPAIANVARHAANLRQARVDGLMLGWTLGGCPSPKLQVVAAVEEAEPSNDASSRRSNEADKLTDSALTPPPYVGGYGLAERALSLVASRRFGSELAPAMVQAWNEFSAAFSEFPFQIGVVYSAPLQLGPANLLWEQATGYHASMVGFPYDDLESWRAVYPAEIFIAQMEKVAQGFEEAISRVQRVAPAKAGTTNLALIDEIHIAEAAAIHFRSTANQARFVLARRALLGAKSDSEAAAEIESLEQTLKSELILARRLHEIQSRDSRIGFEASNQYYYVPL